MERLSLCVSSQTPLVRFNLSQEDIVQKYRNLAQPLKLANLVEGEDYEFTAGGVTRMVFPLLRKMLDEDILTGTHWVSLNPMGPKRIEANNIMLNHVQLEKERMGGYGRAKETMWKTLHGIKKERKPVELFLWQDEFIDYTYYNRLCSELVMKLDKENDFDLFYIHDFQQLPMAHMLHTLKPKVFRWHIPFDESLIPEMWKQSLASYFNAYDTVIVSCKRYLESLQKSGYRGKACYIYPYIDQEGYKPPNKKELVEFEQKFKIREDDRVILVVARLDPMKGQDRAIKGFSRVAKDFPDLKLIVAGDGSFSSSKKGIGLSKAEKWLSQLREIVKTLRIEDRVIFTGHLTHSELQAAYKRCELTLLPSILEGFGLVVIESWLYKKPTIVSSRAGVAELVKHGENGLLFDSDDPDDLTDKISVLLSNPNLASNLGENGFKTSRQCSLDRGARSEAKVMLNMVRSLGD